MPLSAAIQCPAAPSSVRGSGIIHALVIATGNVTIKNARAKSAGLKILYPMPPISCLPKNMAITAPSIGSEKGTPGGRTKASKSPVRTAEPSLSEIFRPIAFWQSASTAAHETTLTRTSARTRQPKRTKDKRSAGMRQAITVHIILETDSFLRTCGEMETTNVFASG